MSLITRTIMPFLLYALFANSSAQAERNDVLVIVNENSIDSIQVGAHYSAQREVPPGNIVHVRLPNQYFISWLEFQSLRDQIIRFGICPSVPLEQRPAACSDPSQPVYTEATINALTAVTPIRYIVMTRGVPTQFTVEPTDTVYDSLPPVDNYLRFWLARYIAVDSPFGSFKERERAFGNGDGMRTIIPAEDREYAIGRVDGADLASAIALVDRAIAAEQTGVYGKLFGSAGGDGGLRNWTNRATGANIYPGDGAPWRYLLGTFNESRPECSDYASSSHYFAFGQTAAQGKSPTHCWAQFHKGIPNELAPAHPSSRHPMPVNALAYIGSLDGQTFAGGFAQVMNWRHETDCATLCSQADDPAACRAASTDPVREINTACVGVAPGFIGYQHQSFPLSHYGIWPTAWTPQTSGARILDVPRVDATRGYDDTYSLWFDRTDEVALPECYGYANGILSTTPQACKANRVLALRNTVAVSGIDGANPPSYRLQFRYNADSIPQSTSFTSRLIFVYPKAAGVACPAGFGGSTNGTECTTTSSASHTLAAGATNGWMLADRVIAPTPNSFGLNYTSIRVDFDGKLPGGNLGLDTVALTDLTTNAQLLANGSFADGHRQAGGGDYASMFLARLGGTAFWGSTSHHFTGGHAFESNALETMIYFMRGLPLAEAVWFDDDSETGLLYGDPLYSPLAVRINPLNEWNFVQAQAALPLSGSTINGRGILVTTLYSVHYCNGSDPYLCGTAANPWLPTGIAEQPGKFANQTLGLWDMSGLAPGAYTLRLSVTSTANGKSQSFNDFLPMRVMTTSSDLDNDGLTDVEEIETYHTDPNRADSDSDQLNDGLEVHTLQTDPNNRDSDGDGVMDGSEDPDGDGYATTWELSAGGDPLDPESIPLAFVGQPVPAVFNAETGIPFSLQLQATWANATFAISSLIPPPAGMSLSPSGALTWTPSYSQGPGPETGGYHYVFLEVRHPDLDQAISLFAVFLVTYGNTGDVNEDGTVNVADVALVERHVLGLAPLSARQTVRADLVPSAAPDGNVEFVDLQSIIQRILEVQ